MTCFHSYSNMDDLVYDFSLEQKKSVVQVALQAIPREQKPPWGKRPVKDGQDAKVEERNEPEEASPWPKEDPYLKSMVYFEKHLILNHFQHMTTKLVLDRPADSLQFMKDWCIQMQQQMKTEKESKEKHDTYDDEVMEVIDKSKSAANTKSDKKSESTDRLSISEASAVGMNTLDSSISSGDDEEDDIVSNISGDNTDL